MKPVRKYLSDEGFVYLPPELSKRSEKLEPTDLEKPWRCLHKALSEVLVLLGPPPASTDQEACRWYERIASTLQAYQGKALLELALVERKRAAPNLSVERVKHLVLSNWPDWDKITLSILEAQEKAATAAALTRHSDNPPPPAGRGGKSG